MSAAWALPADQHVPVRPQPAVQGPQLPSGPARLRRPVDPCRQRRMAVAPAEQPETPGREQLQRREPAWFRPDAAPARLQRLRRPRRQLPEAPERLDRAEGDWGKGTVDLVEIPTADETNDNIVAFWSPEKLPEPGKPFSTRTACTGPSTSRSSRLPSWAGSSRPCVPPATSSNPT